MKKRYIWAGLLILLCVIAAIYMTKPNEEDFVQWFQENYNIQCEDSDCYVMRINSQGVDSENNRFWHAEGYYDTSTGFLAMGMQTKRLYRNVEDPNQYLMIEVKGMLGNFEVMDTSENNIHFLSKE